MRAALAFASVFLVASGANAQDEWLGPDKALHFGVSAGLAIGGYGLGLALFDCEEPRLVLGASIALTAGVAKEIFDAATDGDPSWRDLTWDLIGTVVGLLIAWSVDLVALPRRCDGGPSP